MKLYKLTDENGKTRNNTQWGEGISHEATGEAEQDLCSNGWIHVYESPLLAVLLNPIHADFKSPQLWEAEGEIEKRDGQLKAGVRKLKAVKRIPLPEFSTNQKVAFAILVAKTVYKDERFAVWAENWLLNKDRTAEAAEAAAEAARAAARAARAAEAEIDLHAIAIRVLEMKI